MPDFYKGKIPIIRRSLNEGFLYGVPDHLSTGAIPRDYSVDPVEMRDSPDGMKVYDPSEWDALYDKGEEAEDSLEHLFLRGGKPAFDFLDQNGFPDCWCHSSAHAAMFAYLAQNLPVPRINAVAMATLMGRTNGGWCGLSMKFMREKGAPLVGNGPGEWPYQSRRGRDSTELRESMKKHRSLEDWYDLGRPEYDQTLSQKQIATVLFNNMPMPADFNRAAHSMLEIRLVRIERGSWGLLNLNSWEQWGYFGLGVLSLDDGWWPDNACALRTMNPVS